MTVLAFNSDKRWHRRRERWVRPDRPLFNACGYGVEPMPGRREAEAKAFVFEHHYHGTYPVAQLAVGLYHKAGPCADKQLVGVATFSNGMPAAVAKHTGFSLKDGGIECGRFVCLPSVAFNGETWFQTRAFDALTAEKTHVRSVLSYADPLERRNASGELTKPAHHGTIYRAGNATYVGRARGEPFWLTPDGRSVNKRTITKIQNLEMGWEGGVDLLLRLGADGRRKGEDLRDWLDRVLVPPLFVKVRHPGNLSFVFGLDRQAQKIAAARKQPLPDFVTRRAA